MHVYKALSPPLSSIHPIQTAHTPKTLHKLDGMEMRRMWMDRVRNKEVRSKFGLGEKMSDGVNRKNFTWFRYVERMSEERLSKKMYGIGADLLEMVR